jgi:hypothetical protein
VYPALWHDCTTVPDGEWLHFRLGLMLCDWISWTSDF